MTQYEQGKEWMEKAEHTMGRFTLSADREGLWRKAMLQVAKAGMHFLAQIACELRYIRLMNEGEKCKSE